MIETVLGAVPIRLSKMLSPQNPSLNNVKVGDLELKWL